MPYADAGTQTQWAALTRGAVVSPEFFLTAPDTITPPDDVLTRKLQTAEMLNALPGGPRQQKPAATKGLTLLERRGNNPELASGIRLPTPTQPYNSASQLDEESIPSPPPTQAAVSPLPAANKLYAGHTPLQPGSLSPVQAELEVAPTGLPEHDPPTPQQDPSLSGALSLATLPTNPVNGASEHISLQELDKVLEEVAYDQERFSRLKDAPESSSSAQLPKRRASQETTDDGLPLSRKGSADSRCSEVRYLNGIPLKSPPLNFGVPMGQLKKDDI